MSAVKTTEIKEEKTPVVATTPARSNTPIWLIIVAVIILIALGFIIYFSVANTAGSGISGTIVGIYVLSIVLLIIGIIWAFYV